MKKENFELKKNLSEIKIKFFDLDLEKDKLVKKTKDLEKKIISLAEENSKGKLKIQEINKEKIILKNEKEKEEKKRKRKEKKVKTLNLNQKEKKNEDKKRINDLKKEIKKILNENKKLNTFLIDKKLAIKKLKKENKKLKKNQKKEKKFLKVKEFYENLLKNEIFKNFEKQIENKNFEKKEIKKILREINFHLDQNLDYSNQNGLDLTYGYKKKLLMSIFVELNMYLEKKNVGFYNFFKCLFDTYPNIKKLFFVKENNINIERLDIPNTIILMDEVDLSFSKYFKIQKKIEKLENLEKVKKFKKENDELIFKEFNFKIQKNGVTLDPHIVMMFYLNSYLKYKNKLPKVLKMKNKLKYQ